MDGITKKGIVIAGFSGVGKTTLARKYKNVLDLDSADYAYNDIHMLHIPFETRKGENHLPNVNWPNNYITAIKEAVQKYDFVLVWDREDIIDEYVKNNIDFILCYPVKDDLPNYVKRYRDRGNTEKYIQMKLQQYDDRIEMFENLNVEKIILSNNETLEDYFKKNNFKLEK